MKDLGILNSNGRGLSYIASHPNCTINEMVEGMFLTPTTITSIIGRLRGAGLIDVAKAQGTDGRIHHYIVRNRHLSGILLALETLCTDE